MVLLGYFLIAAIISIAASAIIGLVLTNRLLGCFTRAWPANQIASASEVNEELESANVT